MSDTHTVEFVEEDVTVEVSEQRSLLDVGEELGLDLPYRCRRGICGVCCAQSDGEVDQFEGMFLSETEKDEGYVLTCIAKPLSDLRIETNSNP
jgi:ferredoxin